ncbi:hypothetical protein TrVE_jg4923 [Triparma verrucosa]|uniref:Peptidyl-prolyl cis-trans isomerase n=1 Tax=Triparma verrucosa TaxID=1606542 RepID=A0A9W7EXV6_9STRA|nr:hypothetical protein TrVE_jg4923 [Triparma verrucosa]
MSTATAAGPPEPLPADWVLKRTKDNTHFYYYNMTTGESTWTKPAPVIDVTAVAELAGQILSSKKEKSSSSSSKRPHESSSKDRHSSKRSKTSSSKEPKEKDTGPTPSGKVRVLHILKKHTGSSRPSSWKEKVIKRSLSEARSELSELRSMILSSAPTSLISTFKSLASEESDCSSAKKGGDLGFFEFKKMKRNFSEVAFKLSVNGVSELVETSSGVHLICRLE